MRYLIVLEGPTPLGPFKTEKSRDRVARKLFRDGCDKHPGIHIDDSNLIFLRTRKSGKISMFRCSRDFYDDSFLRRFIK